MTTHKRQADMTIVEAEEAEDAALQLLRGIRGAKRDHVITLEEASEIERLARLTLREARDVTKSAVKTSSRQRVAESWLTVVPMNPTVTQVAQDAGIYDELPLHALVAVSAGT